MHTWFLFFHHTTPFRFLATSGPLLRVRPFGEIMPRIAADELTESRVAALKEQAQAAVDAGWVPSEHLPAEHIQIFRAAHHRQRARLLHNHNDDPWRFARALQWGHDPVMARPTHTFDGYRPASRCGPEREEPVDRLGRGGWDAVICHTSKHKKFFNKMNRCICLWAMYMFLATFPVPTLCVPSGVHDILSLSLSPSTGRLSACLPASLPGCLSVCLSVGLFVCLLPARLSVDRTMCLSVRPSVSLFLCGQAFDSCDDYLVQRNGRGLSGRLPCCENAFASVLHLHGVFPPMLQRVAASGLEHRHRRFPTHSLYACVNANETYQESSVTFKVSCIPHSPGSMHSFCILQETSATDFLIASGSAPASAWMKPTSSWRALA